MSATQSADEIAAVETDVLSLRDNAEVEAYETVPIPRERAKRGEAFTVITDNVTAWPSQRLTWRFQYNSWSGRWTFDCEHPSMGTLFTGRSRAVLGKTYSEYPFFMARFTAPAADTAPTRVTPQNLGKTVHLSVAPGPAGGSFLDAAEVTQAEEDAILGRFASEYPITDEWV